METRSQLRYADHTPHVAADWFVSYNFFKTHSTRSQLGSSLRMPDTNPPPTGFGDPISRSDAPPHPGLLPLVGWSRSELGHCRLCCLCRDWGRGRIAGCFVGAFVALSLLFAVVGDSSRLGWWSESGDLARISFGCGCRLPKRKGPPNAPSLLCLVFIPTGVDINGNEEPAPLRRSHTPRRRRLVCFV